MSRGIQRERQVRRLLEDQGWWTCRAAGSFGDADVVALKAGRILMVECKSTAAGPFSHFGPADRAELVAAAARAGGEAWLCHWPSRKQPRWIASDEWPVVKAAVA